MDILYLARKYILPDLVADCVQLAKQLITSSFVWNILAKSLQNHEEAICEACLTFIRLNTGAAFSWFMFSFNEIGRSSLEFVLDNAMLNIDEEQIVQLCLSWANELLMVQKKEVTSLNIREALGPCLFKVQFQKLTVEKFTELVAKEGLLDDQSMLQFYKYIGSGKDRKDSDHPKGFELKQRPQEIAKRVDIQDLNSVKVKYATSSHMKIRVYGNETKILTRLGLQIIRCQCVKSESRYFDCFFKDTEDSVKVDGVDCLLKITNRKVGNPNPSEQVIRVWLYLRPQEIRGQCVIDINLKPRNDDHYMVVCVTNNAPFLNDDGNAVMCVLDTQLSPIRSITYLEAE